MNATSLLQQAQTLHHAGRLADAERMYAQLLESDPGNADAWFLFGAVALTTGRSAEAVERLERAVQLRGSSAPYFVNLGLAYQGASRLDDARVAFARAASLDPNLPEAHGSLGVVLLNQGRREDAIVSLQRALALRPTYALAHYNLGTALKAEGRIAEAATCFAEAARLEPGLAPAHANLGVMLQEQNDLAGAAVAYQRALALNPNEPETLNNLGTLRRAEGRLEEAVTLFEALIAARPDFGEAYLNLGSALQAQGRIDEAIAAHRRALERGARPEAAFYNLGLAYERQGETQQALDAYAESLRVRPNYAEAYFNAALLHLTRGAFAAGWQGYEDRWRASMSRGKERPFAQPRWGGRRDLAGTLLVWGEQGIGDEILHSRMACELVDAGMDVAFETDVRLVPLLARSCPKLSLIPRRTPPDPTALAPTIAAQIPAASLGQYLRPNRDSFPATSRGYLRADAGRMAHYRARLRASGDEVVVGISWISKNPEIGNYKSAPLNAWAPILQTPGVRIVDLQYGDTAAERETTERALGVAIEHLPDLDLRKDADDTAALIAACDVVITVSNSVAHLAGALGVPVWVMVPRGYGKLWYWGTDETTPWYPSARLFRQTKPGEWTDVIETIAARLKERN